MGVLNVTPDSFSDGGCFSAVPEAVARAEAMVVEGADLIDVGGESTRPGAEPVSEEEECRRVVPVIEALATRISVPISIDTRKVAVARAAVSAGASVVNDVAASRSDPAMGRLVAETGVGYVAMHMRGTPETMQEAPRYDDVVGEVNAFFAERLRTLSALGVAAEQVVLDVGIGFGKTDVHNFELLAGLETFIIHQRPVLLGASRKSLIGRISGAPVSSRLPGSLACAVWAAAAGVQMIRAHDIAATRQALRVVEAILAHRRKCSGNT